MLSYFLVFVIGTIAGALFALISLGTIDTKRNAKINQKMKNKGISTFNLKKTKENKR